MLLVAGITNTFPVFLPALLAEFGGSRAATASTASLLWIGGALLSPVAGYLVARWNPRRLVCLGLAIVAGGMLLGSLAPTLPLFLVAMGIGGGIGLGLTGMTTHAALIADAYVRRRGLATGDRRQAQDRTLGLGAGGKSVQLEGKTLLSGRRARDRCWHRQRPVVLRTLGEQVRPGRRRDVDHDPLVLAFCRADRQRAVIAEPCGTRHQRFALREPGIVLAGFSTERELGLAVGRHADLLAHGIFDLQR